MSTTSLVLIVLAVILIFASMAGGIFCIIRYAKTRKKLFLIIGLLLTFLIPGLLLCLALGVFIPSIMIVYGPPPDYMP